MTGSDGQKVKRQGRCDGGRLGVKSTEGRTWMERECSTTNRRDVREIEMENSGMPRDEMEERDIII